MGPSVLPKVLLRSTAVLRQQSIPSPDGDICNTSITILLYFEGVCVSQGHVYLGFLGRFWFQKSYMVRIVHRAHDRMKTRLKKNMKFYLGRMSKVKKVRVRSANLLGKIDIGLPETMLPAMFVFLKPCYLQCLSQ